MLLPFTNTQASERDSWFKVPKNKFNLGHIECELFVQGSSREDACKTRYINKGLTIEVKTGDADTANDSRRVTEIAGVDEHTQRVLD